MLQPGSGSEVPPNLSALLIASPEALADAGARVPWRLHPSDGPDVLVAKSEVQACPVEASGPGGRVCYRLTLAGGLLPRRQYKVELTGPVASEDGRTFEAGVLGSVSTSDAVDNQPPRLAGVSIGAEAGCLRARFMSDEPATSTVVIEESGGTVELAAAARSLDVDFAVRLPRIPSEPETIALIRASDLAGNPAESARIPMRTSALFAATLVITEVLANPRGSETTQEFVEGRNVGAAPLMLGGWVLEDAAGADKLESIELAPGGFALVVSSGYDPAGSIDVAPASGARLVRVSGRLGGDGLGNAGEAVRLRDPAGAVISSYFGGVPVSAAAWNGKSIRRVPGDQACDLSSSWTREPQDPTPGW
jgi:hypothetical protein